MEFLWETAGPAPSFPSLRGEEKAEVLVIGGGMAGVLCARRLQEAGVDVLLAEGDTIGSGITKGTTAVLTAQHDILYQDLIRKTGVENARGYLEANLQAVEQFRRLSRQIPCDFEDRPSVMYSLYDREILEREIAALRLLGYDAELMEKLPLPFSPVGAVRYPNMAQFHPLKFLYGAAKGLRILEHTFVQKLEGTSAVTAHGRIRANKIVIATHYPFLNSHGLYFLKLYQQRSYVIALENAPKLDCTLADAAKDGIYLRNYGNLLLLGGGDHRTGKTGGAFQSLRTFAKQWFPEAKEKYAWANQDCVSLDGVPYIGPYSALLPNVYVETGFHLWGMTTSMAASEILTDQILGRENPYAAVFAPSRSVLTGQLFSNMGTTLLDFMTPVPQRCSHMGCALKWNAAERTWDCPCHGSRFDPYGKRIDSPAMKNGHVR